MKKQQNYANHGRIDPMFQYFVIPVLFIQLIIRAAALVHRPSAARGWTLVVAMAVLALASLVRTYALRVQDRVIRMEERIRIAAVASPETLARLDDFEIGQLVALRFAPFSELGPLADRALAQRLTPKQIKQSITHWRADTHRV